ncbi:Beta-1,3-galactosyltransferase 1 [Bulinus truncatus]|nr:Beta-1,3-galactosyltransferase 1 [Bulinus truncatus]
MVSSVWQELYCRKIIPEKVPPPLTPRARHVGCTRSPAVIYHNNCPKCSNKWSERFVVNEPERLHPRGTPGYFSPRGERQQGLVEGVLITPWSVCTVACPYVVAIQLTRLDMSEERKTTRLTWASVAKTKQWPHMQLRSELQIVFVVAHQLPDGSDPAHYDRSGNLPSKQQWRSLTTESDLHGDILYLDMMDSYSNLTLKVISSLKWLTDHCSRTKFFLKADADTFINVPVLLDLFILNEVVLSYSIVGFLYNGSRRVLRKGRWAVSRSLYPMSMFPVYVSGCAYVMSADAARTIVTQSPYTPMLPIEDAFVTGVMARVVRANVFAQNDLFTHFFDFKWQRCQMVLNTRVAVTNAAVDEAMDIWSAIVDSNTSCFSRMTSGKEAEALNMIYADYDNQ